SFTYDELRAYYHKWYRPDLQGIIVIGDFDPAVVEAKIKEVFGSIPKPVNPAPRPEFPVPDTKEILVSVNSDPEANGTSVILSFKNDVLPANLKNTGAYTVSDYMNDLIVSMTRARLSEISQKADAPFASATASYGDYIVSPTKASFEFDAFAKEGQIAKTIKVLVNETERIRKFGFTASELERAKANYMSRLEQQYKDRDKQKNSYYVNEALDNFINGVATPGLEVLYSMIQQLQGVITIDQLNNYAKSLPKLENLSLVVMMPKKDGLVVPTKEEVTEYYKTALMDNVEPYKETVSKEPLVAKDPVAGKIVSRSIEPISNSTVWTLSNGATVVIKKTDFKEDQIMMSAMSRGGFSQFDKSEVANTKIIGNVLAIGGLGSFSETDLRKVLAGKNASVSAQISINQESLSGKASPKDLETLLQLTYLNFTAIRTDDEAYKAFKARMETQLKSISADPMTAFSDSLQKAIYGNSPYAKRITPEILEKADYHKALELAKTRFANAADFTFIFVGNVDTVALKPLVEKYIASLPSVKGPKENWKDVGMKLSKGQRVNHFEKEMQTPKASVYAVYTGALKNDMENKIMADMMSQVLDLVFTRTIREEEQGTYGVGVKMNVIYYPEESFLFYFGFDTDVALKDKLLARAYAEIEKVKNEGVDPKDFAKVVEYMTKNHTEMLRENSYWMNVISNKFIQNKDIHSSYDAVLKSITPEKLQKFIKETMDKADKAEIIMIGKAKEVK
ncbi:MAG: insulinase family protein, partial [Thiovulaceae bacterium]|nr:insulinase family protein [Sulfurimonadaceae bacterium]